jgi:hypothetical protein
MSVHLSGSEQLIAARLRQEFEDSQAECASGSFLSNMHFTDEIIMHTYSMAISFYERMSVFCKFGMMLLIVVLNCLMMKSHKLSANIVKAHLEPQPAAFKTHSMQCEEA